MAFSMAILGHANESLEEALDAFDQLLLLQTHGYSTTDPAVENVKLAHLPLEAGVLWGIYQIHKDHPLAKQALKKYYPSILAYHDHLYQHRDPQEDGLISNIHPWETLYSKAEYWNELIHSHLMIQAPISAMSHESLAALLLDRLGRAEKALQVLDPVFHAFLSWSNEALIQIGGVLGEDVNAIMEKYELSIYSINDRLWNAETQLFCPFDQQKERFLPVDVMYSAQCLFSEIATQDRAEELYPQLEKALKKAMQAKIQNEEFHPLAIADQILLFQGLTAYGFDELAVLLVQRLSFQLQQASNQAEYAPFHFLIKGFELFLQH